MGILLSIGLLVMTSNVAVASLLILLACLLIIIIIWFEKKRTPVAPGPVDLVDEVNYKNSIFKKTTSFYENGKIRTEEYENKGLVFFSRSYYESGEIFKKIDYYSKDAIWEKEMYFKSGKSALRKSRKIGNYYFIEYLFNNKDNNRSDIAISCNGTQLNFKIGESEFLERARKQGMKITISADESGGYYITDGKWTNLLLTDDSFGMMEVTNAEFGMGMRSEGFVSEPGLPIYWLLVQEQFKDKKTAEMMLNKLHRFFDDLVIEKSVQGPIPLGLGRPNITQYKTQVEQLVSKINELINTGNTRTEIEGLSFKNYDELVNWLNGESIQAKQFNKKTQKEWSSNYNEPIKNIQPMIDLSLNTQLQIILSKRVHKKAELVKKYYKNPQLLTSKEKVNVTEVDFKNDIVYHNKKVFSGIIFEEENGKLKLERQIINGKSEGLSIEYNIYDQVSHYDVKTSTIEEYEKIDSTKIKIVRNYKNNKLDGMFEEYWANGKLRLQIEYKDGKKQGVWNTFYKDGEFESQIECLNDKEEGRSLFFRENGYLDTVGYWKNGKKNGWFETYYETGEVMAAGLFENDIRSGYKWRINKEPGQELLLIDTKTGKSLTEDEMIKLGIFSE